MKIQKEYELIYYGKERDEDIITNIMSIPLQKIKAFGKINNEWHNKLIFGENLQVLKYLLKLKNKGMLRNPDGKSGIKMIYIDPPFASKQELSGSVGQKAYQDKISGVRFLETLRKRLVLLKELLTNDGCIYVHLDYRKSHYIKILMDEIFDESNFLNDLIWCYKEREMHLNYYNRKHDIILFYKKDSNANHVFNSTEITLEYSAGTIKKYNLKDEDNRLFQIRGKGGEYTGEQGLSREIEKEHPDWTYRDYLDEKTGIAPRDWFSDIPFLNRAATERIGYPTQKPERLLERIIKVSSNEGDIVLDCFAGSGTTGAVAEKLNRKWIMVDSSKLAIYTIQKRLLNLKEDIGNKGKKLSPKTFVLYNAGIYENQDFLAKMKTNEYIEFVLEMFQVENKEHELNGLKINGLLNNRPVIVFSSEFLLTKEFINELHDNLSSTLKDEMYIIAPASRVNFHEDYIRKDNSRYVILRIPYSIIEVIKKKNFVRIEQPRSKNDINRTIEQIGFDFIYPPMVTAKYYKTKPKVKQLKIDDMGVVKEEVVIEIDEFIPIQISKNPVKFKDPKSEALAMVMIDKNYNGKYFNLDEYFFGKDIIKKDYMIRLEDQNFGEEIMIIYLDVLGNEKREVIKKSDFG